MVEIQWDIRTRLIRIEAKIDNLATTLNQLVSLVRGDTLNINFIQGEQHMAGRQQKHVVKMGPKGSAKPMAAMPPVKWSTLAAGIQFLVVDANGQSVGAIDPTTVTTTLVADDTSTPPVVSTLATTAAGSDSLNWKVSRTLSTGNIVLNATITWNDGSKGPFSASLPVELDAVPPGAPTDLQLVISGN